MNTSLPFFNWSLKKALDTLPDSFARAQVRIVYIVLLFSLLKASIVIGFSGPAEQWMQFARAVAGIIGYTVLLKILLFKPTLLRLLSHIMLIAGILLIWSSIFAFTHTVNLPTLQFVFMVILASFYTLGRRAGIIYSVSAIIPVLLFVFFKDGLFLLDIGSGELASPGFEIIIFLNFLTITLAHAFFYRAFDGNIREKEKLNEKLQVAASEARQLAESRSNFLSTMSHELRTPLNSVVGISELLLEGRQDDDSRKENLQLLRYSALDLLSLINNVLDINKLDSEKLELENTPFKPYQLVHNICSILRIKARDKQLSLDLDVDEPLKRMVVNSDPTRLSQVIYNVAGNAIKFTDTGGVAIQMRLLKQEKGNAVVQFAVSDTGIGIATERHLSIFESFTQAEPGTTRKYGGTGLGLAIVKQVLLLFNSEVQLESIPGKGSRFVFTITFPVAADAKETLIDDKSTGFDLSHLRILVAEDNEVNQLVLQKQMNNLNITPLIVTDGMQAYDAYISGEFDVVLLDLDMPKLNGYETSRKIRLYSELHGKPAYLVAFTASALAQNELQENGFNEFLYKPVSIKELRTKLEKVITPPVAPVNAA